MRAVPVIVAVASLCTLAVLALWYLRATLCGGGGGNNTGFVTGPTPALPAFGEPDSEELTHGLLPKDASIQGPGPGYGLREKSGPTFMAT